MRLNERVTVDLEVSMNYGDEGGGATIDWSLRVKIREEGGPSKGSQPAEGLAHWSGWDDRDATYGEALWEVGRDMAMRAGTRPMDGRSARVVPSA